jgi:uncharacterized protein YcbX
MQSLRSWVSYFAGTSAPQVTVSQLWIYPIKSCRGIPVDSAQLAAFGFENDRVYMLVEEKPGKDDPSKSVWIPMTMRTWPRVQSPKSLTMCLTWERWD